MWQDGSATGWQPCPKKNIFEPITNRTQKKETGPWRWIFHRWVWSVLSYLCNHPLEKELYGERGHQLTCRMMDFRCVCVFYPMRLLADRSEIFAFLALLVLMDVPPMISVGLLYVSRLLAPVRVTMQFNCPAGLYLTLSHYLSTDSS